MNRLQRLLLTGGLLTATLGLGRGAAAGSQLVLVPGSSTQHALAVSLAAGVVTARACRAGASCSAAGGESWTVPADAVTAKGQVESVMLGGDKGIAVVTVPLQSGGEWVLLVAASDAKDAPAALKKLSGTLGAPRGSLEGERFSRVLLRNKTATGTRLVIGKRYENATVCGRPATLSAQELDPTDMAWRDTHTRSLSGEEQTAATSITAKRVSTPVDLAAPSLLTATVASSAIGRARSGMTDGKLDTRWAEKQRGDGRGELISMSGSEEVAVTGFEIVVKPTGETPVRGAAPKTFFIATGDQLFRVTMPEDAWLADAGQTFEVTLPKPVRSDCYSVVLDEGFTDADHDEVGFAELRARTELDGKTHEELAEMLRGDEAVADAARALLTRSGPLAVKAVMLAYDGLDRRGQGRALEVVESGSCADTAPFYVDRLLGRGVNLKEFEPDLDPLAQRAHANLQGCRGAAADALQSALAREQPGKRRVIAARELADIAPALAVGAIVGVLGDGSTAPAQSGAKDEVRRGMRRALASAVKHRRGKRAVADMLAAASFAQLSLIQQIDLLRALGPTINSHGPAASAALTSLFDANATFRTRYLLLPAAAHLARAKDDKALTLLKTSLVDENSPHIRARAAAVAGGIPALADALTQTLTDTAPRVREAALAGMTGSGAIPGPAVGRIVELLAHDKWTFVRMGAAQALARQPAGGRADAALIAALEDESNTVRRAVLRALGERKSVAAGTHVHDIADNAKEQVSVRAAAIVALGALCRSESAELLYKLALRAGYQQLPYDQPLGLAALSALGELKPADLDERLAPLLAKSDRVPRAIRSITRDVLTRTGSCK